MSINILQAFEETPPPLDFVLPGLLAGTVGGVISPGGAGKSMLALELSILVATGFDLSGFGGDAKRPTGKVAFLAAEDPADAIRHRLHALGQHLNMDLREQFAQEFEIEPLTGMQIDIDRPDWLQFVESMAADKRLIFLDTLRRFHELDENDSGQMAHLVGILEGIARRTGCAIVFLHHASKSAAINGQGDMQQASRGSSVLVDNIRWQMYLAGASKEEARTLDIDEELRGYFVRTGVSKQNYGPPAADIWMRRSDGGVLIPAVLSTSSLTAKKKGGRRERETL
jgi:RecA-family ATPase